MYCPDWSTSISIGYIRLLINICMNANVNSPVFLKFREQLWVENDLHGQARSQDFAQGGGGGWRRLERAPSRAVQRVPFSSVERAPFPSVERAPSRALKGPSRTDEKVGYKGGECSKVGASGLSERALVALRPLNSLKLRFARSRRPFSARCARRKGPSWPPGGGGGGRPPPPPPPLGYVPVHGPDSLLLGCLP